MSQQLVQQFLNDLDRYKKYSGSLNEGVISEAFKDLLKAWARQEAFRCSMQDTENLLKLLNLFFGYERPEIAEFRKAVAQFKADLPMLLHARGSTE